MASLERVKLGDQEQLLLRQGQLTSSRRGELYSKGVVGLADDRTARLSRRLL
jgi:hypothetical protein